MNQNNLSESSEHQKYKKSKSKNEKSTETLQTEKIETKVERESGDAPRGLKNLNELDFIIEQIENLPKDKFERKTSNAVYQRISKGMTVN